mmetsp:Transcript_27085/g.68310  ORF Transcript_27085/g.68310 Transcript_27085/m.68310 type:complete len:246 (+) Transcript_27085:2399-3136(+)
MSRNGKRTPSASIAASRSSTLIATLTTPPATSSGETTVDNEPSRPRTSNTSAQASRSSPRSRARSDSPSSSPSRRRDSTITTSDGLPISPTTESFPPITCPHDAATALRKPSCFCATSSLPPKMSSNFKRPQIRTIESHLDSEPVCSFEIRLLYTWRASLLQCAMTRPPLFALYRTPAPQSGAPSPLPRATTCCPRMWISAETSSSARKPRVRVKPNDSSPSASPTGVKRFPTHSSSSSIRSILW